MLNAPYSQKIGKPRPHSMSGRIRAALDTGPRTMRDIAEFLGENEKTVNGILSTLQFNGFVRCDWSCRPIIWSLTDKGRRAVEGR